MPTERYSHPLRSSRKNKKSMKTSNKKTQIWTMSILTYSKSQRIAKKKMKCRKGQIRTAIKSSHPRSQLCSGALRMRKKAKTSKCLKTMTKASLKSQNNNSSLNPYSATGIKIIELKRITRSKRSKIRTLKRVKEKSERNSLLKLL